MLSTGKQTNKQTDRQTGKLTNATKNITSFAKEVIISCPDEQIGHTSKSNLTSMLLFVVGVHGTCVPHCS